MAVSVEKFLQQLSESGVWTPDELSSFQAKIPPDSRGRDAQWLAAELVNRQKLTQFQADSIYQDEPIPLVLGNYVIQEKIGIGGMGVVYKAQHRRMKRVVAVKVLTQKAIRSVISVKRFLREVETAARLTHPNIVAAFDADEIDGVPFLVMEFVDGIDLAVHVRQNGPMSCGQAVDCIRQAAQGLEYAHAKGIVHRDIKPANILLDRHGSIKILDMGLARLEEVDAGVSTVELVMSSDSSSVTQSGALVGTVDYMSPEQALDSRLADHVSDVYSLGATLFYLLTGRPMFEHDYVLDRVLAHRNASRPSLSALNEAVPVQLDRIYRKMVSRRPEKRYQTMGELIHDLSQRPDSHPPIN